MSLEAIMMIFKTMNVYFIVSDILTPLPFHGDVAEGCSRGKACWYKCERFKLYPKS
jgi:hypothetical protein